MIGDFTAKEYRDLLFKTSQGVAALFFSVLNLLAGIIYLTAPASIATLEPLRAGLLFLAYPLFLIAMLGRISYLGEIESSWFTTVLVTLLGVLPFALPYLRDAKLLHNIL